MITPVAFLFVDIENVLFKRIIFQVIDIPNPFISCIIMSLSIFKFKSFHYIESANLLNYETKVKSTKYVINRGLVSEFKF